MKGSKAKTSTDRTDTHESPGNRSRRVVLLLAGIIVLSLADLTATIHHLSTIGMIEANPIAHYILETTRSMWGLVAYKMATVTICVALLYRLRRYAQGEAAAWCGLVILALLTVYWGHYADIFENPEYLSNLHEVVKNDRWINLAEMTD